MRAAHAMLAGIGRHRHGPGGGPSLSAVRLDHLALSVGDVGSVRDWYVSVLDLTVEFAVEDPPTVGLRDDGDFTLILTGGTEPSRCSLYFQVDDVWDAHRRLTERGIAFVGGPRANPWGFG